MPSWTPRPLVDLRSPSKACLPSVIVGGALSPDFCRDPAARAWNGRPQVSTDDTIERRSDSLDMIRAFNGLQGRHVRVSYSCLARSAGATVQNCASHKLLTQDTALRQAFLSSGLRGKLHLLGKEPGHGLSTVGFPSQTLRVICR